MKSLSKAKQKVK